jgi:hypothetical protein
MTNPASFIPASELLASDAASAAGLPRGCTFSATDWNALAPFWYPAAFSHAVTDKPYAARLLEETLDFNNQVFQEDIAIVEQQWPEDLPHDLHAEAHFPADRSSIPYRKGLAALGLGRYYTA